MKYNLAKPAELDEAAQYLAKLAGKEAEIELKEVRRNRTLPQNAYLHLILTAFGMHFGYTLSEAKHIYKIANESIYYYEKKGRIFEVSSAVITKEDMAHTIDRFMRLSAEQGCELPLATDPEWLKSIANEAERSMFR